MVRPSTDISPEQHVVWSRLVTVRGFPGEWCIYHDGNRASGVYKYRADAVNAAKARAYTLHRGIKT